MQRLITISFILSALLISVISYLRYFIVGYIDLERVYPNHLWSLILFILYFIAIMLALIGYYNVLFNGAGYSFKRLRTLAYIVFLISFIALPLLSSDIFTYIVAGDFIANLGLNPYTDYRFFYLSSFDKYISPTWQNTSYFKYGPVNAIIMSAVGYLGGSDSIWLNLLFYKLIVVLFGIGFIEFAYFVLEGRHSTSDDTLYNKRKLIFSFVVLSPVLWIQGISQGHNDIFVALFLYVGLYFMTRGKYFLSCLFFTLSFNVKLYAILSIFMLLYYMLFCQRFSYQKLVQSFFIIAFSLCISAVLYVPFWDGIDTILLSFVDVLSGSISQGLIGPMNSLSFLFGYLVEKLFPLYSSSLSYNFFYYLILIPAMLLGLYLLFMMRQVMMRQDGRSFVYLAAKSFILLFSFAAARFHPWYFMTSLAFFSFRDISKSWLLWGAIFFSSVNLIDIYNFMSHDSLAIKIALPLSLLFVNLFLLFRLKKRFVDKD